MESESSSHLISIIVPVYNSEEFLNYCLDSLIDQTYKNIEIILIDDGSTDKSGQICDEYARKDSRVMVSHNSNRGQSFSRNVGIEASKGDYVAFVDSDDYIKKDFISVLHNLICSSNSDIAACSIQRVDKNGKYVGNGDVGILNDSLVCGEEVYDISRYFNSSCNKLFKRDLLRDIRFPVNIGQGEDAYFTHKISLKAKKIITTSEVLYFYRVNQNSFSHSDLKLNDARNCADIQYRHFIEVSKKTCNSLILNNCYGAFLFHFSKLIKWDGFWDSDFKDDSLKQYFDLRGKIKKISIRNFKKTLYVSVLCLLLSKISMKKVKKIVKRLLTMLIYLFFKVDNNQVFLTNFFGASYEGGLKSVSESLLKKCPQIKIVYAVSDLDYNVPSNILKVKYKSLKYYKLFYKSKVIISNIRNNLPRFKKKQQFYIQIWHGLYSGAKKVEKDAANSLSKNYLKSAKLNGRQTDLMISHSRKQTELFHNSFWYKGPVLEIGSPDFDKLFDYEKHDQIRQKVFNALKIAKGKSIIVYAPTFRNYYNSGVYDIDFERLIKVCNDKFNKNFAIIFHYHKNTPQNQYAKIKYDNINYFDGNNLNIVDLEIAGDIGIGDYSGFNLEFALLKKPVFRYVSDLVTYNQERNSYIPFENIPFPFALNNNNLMKVIADFDRDEYERELSKYVESLKIIANANSSNDIAVIILDVLKIKSKQKLYKKYKNLFIWPNKRI